jgi:uncharacterized Tic20 family protein
MDLEKLEKLNELKEKGAITEEEYQKAKAETLAPSKSLDVNNLDDRSYSMLMHFAQFCSFIVPLLGWVVPLVMWLTRRDNDYIDQHGKVVANWIISAFIYSLICFVLMFVLIGFLFFVVLVICSIVFTIMGGIQAKDGIIRNYPLAIRFFAVQETPRTLLLK